MIFWLLNNLFFLKFFFYHLKWVNVKKKIIEKIEKKKDNDMAIEVAQLKRSNNN